MKALGAQQAVPQIAAFISGVGMRPTSGDAHRGTIPNGRGPRSNCLFGAEESRASACFTHC